jgi:cytochrome oxidase Cu insertion factor (SCO1/SenC/PrrC family)
VLKRGVIYLSILIILAASCTKGPPVPFPAFDFTVEDLFTGEEIHLEDLIGRPIILYFFASW